jgi:hypothetical protein
MGGVEGQKEDGAVVDFLDCGVGGGTSGYFWVSAECYGSDTGVGFGEGIGTALSI